MHFLALAADYDGTLGQDSRVSGSAIATLKSVRTGFRKFLFVTGQVHDELFAVFPEIPLFDRVVTENSAVVYDPATHGTIICLRPRLRGDAATARRDSALRGAHH